NLHETALRYAVPDGAVVERQLVHDPLPYRGESLRYTPTRPEGQTGWPLVLSYAEQLAREYAVLARMLAPKQRAGAAALAASVGGMQEELARQQAWIQRCEASLQQQQRQLTDTDRALREMTRRYLAEAQRVQDEVARSWTWRIGRLIVGPFGWLKRFGIPFS